ncbi:TPA: hypothetical protein N0F65_006885 [Lagenidium giganteum]|uniref:Yeast cell wall synthesis Kre9/Knh1-like N-terminal domain-containing protein n=1 Tax=Lagenidium giganteum TaxID=4803 RepID=A0AAV2ZCZ9_9STRA|nr:TPA: hypothetical protein N0F65_006885 [Lagenidium giganteum]
MRDHLEPAPPIVRAAYRGAMERVSILQEPTTATDVPAANSKLLLAAAAAAAAPQRRSLGETDRKEWRRHTFCVSVDTDAEEDNQRQAGSLSTPPPKSSPGLVQPRSCTARFQHLRRYPTSMMQEADKHVTAETHQGDAFVDMLCPSKHTVWTRGKPVSIEWNVIDSKVDSLRIELMEEGSTATTVIAKEAPNDGHFTYSKVPWGMASGDKYFLRISSCADPSRFMTTALFQIGTAP